MKSEGQSVFLVIMSHSNVKNPEVVFDSNLSLSDLVSQVKKSARVHTRDLYRIHHLLDFKTSVLLANALVNSKFDYCNYRIAH